MKNSKKMKRKIDFKHNLSIYWSFRSEWWAELKKHSPSDEELQEFFKQLDQSDKDNLLRLSGSKQSGWLKYLYYRHQGRQSKFHKEYSEFRDVPRPYYRSGPRRGRSRNGRGNPERGRNRGEPKGKFAPGKG